MNVPVRLCLLSALVLSAPGCGQKQATPPPAQKSAGNGNGSATMFTNSSGSNPLTAPVDYLSALGRGRESAIKTVDIAQLHQAIQMFNIDQGRFPKDLNELVEKGVIPKIPDAPYGLKLDYNPGTGEVKVVKQ